MRTSRVGWACLVVFVQMIAASAAYAQLAIGSIGNPSEFPKELRNPWCSTPLGQGWVLGADVYDTANITGANLILPVNSVVVSQSTDGWASTSTVPLARVDSNGQFLYYESAPVAAPGAGLTDHLFWTARTDSTVSSMLPSNAANTYPPPANFMYLMANDAVGDEKRCGDSTVAANAFTNTDLRSFSAGQGPGGKVYFSFVTGGGTQLTHAGVDVDYCGSDCCANARHQTVWHIYTMPIVGPYPYNTDSCNYAIIMGNISISVLGYSVHVGSGLYRIKTPPSGTTNLDPYLVRVGLIDTQTVGGNTMQIRFNINDAINDTNTIGGVFTHPFGPYDPSLGFTTGIGVASAWLAFKPGECGCSGPFLGCLITSPLGGVPDSFAFVINDVIPFNMQIYNYERTVVGSALGSAPTAGVIPAVPDSGLITDTFTIGGTFTDADTNLPVTRTCVVDAGSPRQLLAMDHYSVDGSAWTTRVLASEVGGGWHRYTCSFSDGNTTVTSPMDSFKVITPLGLTIAGADGDPSWTTSFATDAAAIIPASQMITVTNTSGTPIDIGLWVADTGGEHVTDTLWNGNPLDLLGLRTDAMQISAIINQQAVPPLNGLFTTPLDAISSSGYRWANGIRFLGGGHHIAASGTANIWLRLRASATQSLPTRTLIVRVSEIADLP